MQSCKCDYVHLPNIRELQKFRTYLFCCLTSIKAYFLPLRRTFGNLQYVFFNHAMNTYFKRSWTIWFLQMWLLNLLNISPAIPLIFIISTLCVCLCESAGVLMSYSHLLVTQSAASASTDTNMSYFHMIRWINL